MRVLRAFGDACQAGQSTKDVEMKKKDRERACNKLEDLVIHLETP